MKTSIVTGELVTSSVVILCTLTVYEVPPNKLGIVAKSVAVNNVCELEFMVYW